MTITIELTEERADQLKTQASKLGITVEQFAERSILAALSHRDPKASFRDAAEYVLKKDAELLKRLA